MVNPETVVSPKSLWTLHTVIHGAADWSLAIGTWDGARNLGCRWNGDAKRPLGRPVAHGKPIWFMLPTDLWVPIMTPAAPDGARSALTWLQGDDGNEPVEPAHYPRRRAKPRATAGKRSP